MTALLPQQKQKQIDEYGFVIRTAEQKKQWDNFLSKMWHRYHGGIMGNTNHCKDLCRYLKHYDKMLNSKLMPPGYRWCKECHCLFKCARCRCCGNLGRIKARHRKRDNEKRIE